MARQADLSSAAAARSGWYHYGAEEDEDGYDNHHHHGEGSETWWSDCFNFETAKQRHEALGLPRPKRAERVYLPTSLRWTVP